METADNYEEVGMFFEIMLQIFAKPTHYTKLIEHFVLAYAGIKTFFHSYSESEMFKFFRNKSDCFLINSDGFVSLVKNEIIKSFVKFIKVSGSRHFLELVNALDGSSIYFSGLTTSEKFKFFSNHPKIFNIQDSGCVELAEGNTTTNKNFYNEKETELLAFFQDYLASYGPVYFSWLFESLPDDYISDELYMEVELWNFLESHPLNFIISDQGFVDLMPCQKSTIKVDAIISGKGEELLGFFIAKLVFYGSVLYSLLLKSLQDSTHDIRHFFSKQSLSDVQSFFTKRSDVFVMRDRCISLWNTISFGRLINFEDSKFPFEEKQEAIFFFLDCLKAESPIHFLHLSSMLKNSSIKTKFKHTFLQSQASVKFWFFKNNSEVFHIENNGYISLYSLSSLSGIGKQAILHSVKKLMSSPENFWTLITSLEASSEHFQNYFANFSPADKFYFFKKYSNVFSVDLDGYVTCETELAIFPEIEAVKVLGEKLKKAKQIHFVKLCDFGETVSKSLKEFFKPYSISEKFKFFKDRPEYFHIYSDGYVSFPASSAPKTSTSRSVPQNTSNCQPLSIANDAIVQSGVNGIEQNYMDSGHATLTRNMTGNKQSMTLVSDTEISNQNLNGNAVEEDHAEIDGNLSLHGKEASTKSNENLSFHDVKDNNAETNGDLSFHDVSVTEEQSGKETLNMQEARIPELSQHLQKLPCNTTFSNIVEELPNDISISTAKSSMAMTYDIPSDTGEYRQKDAVNKALTDILKAYKRVHYEKLCYYNECSDTKWANYFLSYSNTDKYKFFKSQPEYFSVGIDGYVSIARDTQNYALVLSPNNLKLHEKITAQQPWPPVSLADGAMNDTRKSNVSISSNTGESMAKKCSTSFCTSYATSATDNNNYLSPHNMPDHRKLSDAKQTSTTEDDVIGVLKYYLNIHKRMHCLILCKAAKIYFTSYSHSQKFSFFKDRPQHFCIDNDNFVTFSSSASNSQNISVKKLKAFIAGNTSTVSKTQRKKMKKNEVVKILINTLQNQEQVHFEKLCNGGDKTVRTYFQYFTTSAKFYFFKQKPNFFLTAANGYVSLPKNIQNTDKFSVSFSASSSSTANSSAKSLNSKKSEVKFPSALMGEQPTKTFISKNLADARDSGVTNSKLGMRNSKNNLVSPAKVSKSNNLVPSTKATSVVDSSSDDSDITLKHVIDAFKTQLRSCKRMHYLELCMYVERHNETVRDFFASQRLFQKIHFFEKYPNDFHVSANNFVCLPEFEKNFFNPVSVTKGSSATKESSAVPFEYLLNLEKDVIDILIDVLKVFQRVHFEKLCKFNDKVENFFVSYSMSERYKFYRSRPQYFCLGIDSYVSRSEAIEDSSKLGLVAASKSLKSNIESDTNCENDKTSDVQCNAIVPVESSSHTHAHDCNNSVFVGPSSSLMLDNSKADNFTNCKANGKFCSSIVSENNEAKPVPSVESGYVNDNASVLSLDANVNANSEISETNACITMVTQNNKVIDMSESSHSSGITADSLIVGDKKVNQLNYKSHVNYKTVEQSESSEIDSANVLQEIIETLINQLMIYRSAHFLKLCDICEKSNGIIRNFFYFLTSTEKLDFLKSYPQYFLIDSDNFVKISSAVRTSTNVSHIENNSCLASRQTECTTSHNNATNSIGRCTVSPNEKSPDCSFGINSVGKSRHNSSSRSSSIENKGQDANMEGLTRFFHSVLCNADTLHYEELFAELEYSDGFANIVTSFEQTGRLKFFEDQPNIFDVQPQGFISLVPGADLGYSQENDMNTENICNKPALIPDIVERKPGDELVHNGLCLSYYHIFTIKYFIKILQLNQPLHFKQLVKDVCVEHPDVKSFFILFRASTDLLDFFKMHPMYFVVDGEMVLKRLDITSEKVLCGDAELQCLFDSIILKAVDFYTCVLKTKVEISLKESESQLHLAPGFVISFMDTNYPGSKIENFFKEHPDYFLIDDNGGITLNSCQIGEYSKNYDNTAKERTVFSEASCSESENDAVGIKLKENNANAVNLDENHLIASKAQENKEILLKSQNSNEVLSPIQENVDILSKNSKDINISTGIQENKEVLLSEIQESINVLLHTQENSEIFSKEYEGSNSIPAIEFLPQHTSPLLHKLVRPSTSNSRNPSSELERSVSEIKFQDFFSEKHSRLSLSNVNPPFHVNKAVESPKVKSILPSAAFHSMFSGSCSKTLPSDRGKTTRSENVQVYQLNKDFKQELIFRDTSPVESHSDVAQGSGKVPIAVKPQISRSALELSCFDGPRSQYLECYPTERHDKISSNLSLPVTKNKFYNATNNIHSLMPIIPNAKNMNGGVCSSLPIASYLHNDLNTTTNYSNIFANKSVDQLSIKADERNQLPNQQRIQALLTELNPITRIFNPELEMLCVNFFKDVIQKKAPRILHVQFLCTCASQSPDVIRTYLSHYIKRDLLLFFYQHLDHFLVDPSGYVNLKIAPDRSKTDEELEVKMANFFISLIYFSFKGKAACDVLERCLHLASEEVQLYVKEIYATNLKLFFNNHPDHFYVDVFNNVFVKDEEN